MGLCDSAEHYNFARLVHMHRLFVNGADTLVLDVLFVVRLTRQLELYRRGRRRDLSTVGQ